MRSTSDPFLYGSIASLELQTLPFRLSSDAVAVDIVRGAFWQQIVAFGSLTNILPLALTLALRPVFPQLSVHLAAFAGFIAEVTIPLACLPYILILEASSCNYSAVPLRYRE